MKHSIFVGVVAMGALLFQGVAWAQDGRPVPGEDPPPLTTFESVQKVLEPTKKGQDTNKMLPMVGGAWVAQGPAAATGGQIEGIPNQPVSGAIHTVVAHPTDADILWLGATNGGIWKTENATAASPTWTPLIDDKVSLSIGALELDPTDATNQTLIAGQGRYSSFSQAGGPLEGIYRTTDGGTTWSSIEAALLSGESCSGIAARGNTLLFSANNFASAGGLFRSTDLGVSWTTISGGGGTGLPSGGVHDLVGDPNVLIRFYCSVDDTGVYRSDDSGATWTLISDAAQQATFGQGGNNNGEIAIAPNGRVYVAIVLSGQVESIEYSDNPTAGTPTWTRMDLPTLPSGATSVVVAATNATPIVITTSTAHGLGTGNFVEITGVTGNTAANGVFRVGAVTGTTLELTGSGGNGAYVSGGTAQRVFGMNPRNKPGGQGGIHLAILADRTDSNTIYIGGDRQDLTSFPNFIGAFDFTGNLWRGDTTVAATGASPSPQWEHLTHSNSVAAIPGGGTATGTAPHADAREMVFDANGNIIETDDGGIYRRTSPTDNTGDWISLNGNLQVTEQHNVAYDTVSNIVMSGNQDTGTTQQTSENGLVWESISTADGGDVAVDVTSLAMNSFRYSSFQNLGSFRRSQYNAAATLQSTDFPALTTAGTGFSNSFVTPVEVNSVDGTRLVVGGVGIRESFDRGDSANLVLSNTTVTAMSYGMPGAADVLWASNFFDVYFRQSGTGSPTLVTVNPIFSDLRDIVIYPVDTQSAFLLASSEVHVTRDGGTTWTEVTGNLVNTDLRTIEYVSNGSAAVVVGGYGGVYAMEVDAAGEWRLLGTGLPNVVVYDLDYDAVDDVLVAGTLGRGAWKLTGASINGDLDIDGGDFTPTGDVGGPFAPASKDYMLTNNSVSDLAWTVSVDANWIDLSIGGLTLTAGSSTTLTASVNGNANSLPPGEHVAILTFTNQTSGQAETKVVTLQVLAMSLFAFDFDTDPGWTTEGLWAFGTPTGQGTSPGDPTSGNTGSNVYGYNLFGDYENFIQETALTTTSLDFSSAENVTLHFFRWLGVEASNFDNASIQVSNDGSTYGTVWQHSGGNLLESSWSEQSVDISAIADGQSTVFVRWVMGATDTSITYAGWNIDDVVFRGEINGPMGTAITPSTVGPTNAATLSYTVDFNEDVTGFDGEPDLVITETGTVAHTGVVISGGPMQYTVDVTGITGDGSIALAVSTSSDVADLGGTPLDSSVTSSVTVIDNSAPVITVTAPTSQNFECGTGGYTDPGFMAMDDVDGDITGSVVVSGDTVDTGALATYTVLYDVMDAAGNAAVQASRTIVVEDTMVPAFTLTGLRTVELMLGDSFEEPGFSAVDVCAGDITADVVVTSDVDTGTAGTYTVTYTVSDPSGNEASTTRTVIVSGVAGDVDGDGSANSIDIQLVINNVLGTVDSGMSADLNNDGVINSVDIQLIINTVLGII